MLWFFAGLYTLLKEDWRARIALVSGVVFVAIVSAGGWELVTFRESEGVDPQLARLAFDLGNVGFATSWVALGSFLIATGWALLSLRTLSAWSGWWAIAAGICLIAARAVWTNPFWLVGYGLFWVWVLVLCVTVLHRQHALSR
ncbi:hypothetical protein [Nonomuraea basaltis]|uniref:hypothetical protein n=1 Tax=Nonomuraea basaltis TaxID=2495887 RepID=UPI00110C495D|nr:hypothetical protein [Nonomuraea basaltis]TMR88628.1 hypothetical protein EJK15_65160 [Nonomuraea basaltis]